MSENHDEALLLSLSSLWQEALNRGLVAGEYVTRGQVQEVAEQYAQPIDQEQAAEAVKCLQQRIDDGEVSGAWKLMTINAVWDAAE